MNNLDIKTFEFNGSLIEAFRQGKDQIWFIAKSVALIMGYPEARNALKILREDEKTTISINRDGQKRKVSLINESGLYHLIFKSSKPEAESFRQWVTSEVLPSIRRTGQYSMKPVENKLAQLNENWEEIQKLELEIEEDAKNLNMKKGLLKDMLMKHRELMASNPYQLTLPIN